MIKAIALAALLMGMAECAVRIQKPAPDFTAEALVDGDFATVSLSDYRGKYVVLLFYPADWSFVCPTELTSFSDALPEFRKLGAEVLALSVDTKFSHFRWAKQPRSEGGLGKIQIPLVSDVTKSISKDYGVLLEDGPDAGLSLRGLFIIDGEGILRQITMNDTPVGRSVDETLRLLAAFRYTDTHGEVCPAGWKPGSGGIVPHPKRSVEWFHKNRAEDL